MISKLIRFSVKNPIIIGAFVFIMASVGGISLYNLPIDAVPDVTGTQVDIITVSPSLASLEVERFITTPIEMSMSNISGLKEIRSISKFGLSSVKLIFEDNVDIYWARAQVSERFMGLSSEIPAELGVPSMGPISTGLGEIYQYIVKSKDPEKYPYTAVELRTIQDWIVRKQLLGTPGIADISSFGGFKKEYQARVRPYSLKSLGVTIDELYEALQKGNANTGGGYIEKFGKAYSIRGIGLAGNLEDLGNTVIKMNGPTPVLVKDVADVEIGTSLRYGAMTTDGEETEAVGGIIMMMKGANGYATVGNLEEKLHKIEASLPAGLEIKPFINRSDFIGSAINTVATNLVEGATIVVIVILLFLGNWRASLLAASVIPLSMLFAFIMMQVFHVEGNVMSLGAIDFGLLVDPSIIVVESVVLYLALELSTNYSTQVLDYKRRQEIIIKGAVEVQKSVIYGGLIILIVYFPILTLSGIEGKMFSPMAKTVSFAIFGAIILAITYVPMMSALVLRPPKSAHEHGPSEVVVAFIYKYYEKALLAALRYKKVVIGFGVVLLLGGVFAFTRLGGEFLPKIAEGDMNLEISLPVGGSLTNSIDLSKNIQKRLLKEFPDEVRTIVSKIGTSEIPTDPQPLERHDMIVSLYPKKQWKKAKDQWELAALMSDVLKEYPGLVVSLTQPIENRVNDLITGARTDVVVKCYGPDLTKLNQVMMNVKSEIAKVEGVVDLQNTRIYGLPQINIKYDRAKMAQYGITVDQINNAVQMMFAGAIAGTVFENDKRFDLTMRLSDLDRSKLENIQTMLISDLSKTKQIPLYQLCEFVVDEGVSEVQRENLNRKAVVGFNVRGRDMESVVNDGMKLVKQNIKLPNGYTVVFGGQFENLRNAKSRLAIVVPISLLIIFGLLFATFGNAKDSGLIYSVVPLSAVGGIFSLLFRDMNFSISAGVGFIALFGIAVLNGILLISHFNFHRDITGIKNVDRRVLVGIKEKFRPILMTSAVAALGFMPMAMSTSVGSEVQRPLATVVIGGLFTATVLALFILPVLYALVEASSQSKTERKNVNYNATLIVLVLLGVGFLKPSTSEAQKMLTEKEALEIGLKNNPLLKIAEKRIDKESALRKTAFTLDNTEIYMEAPTGTQMRPAFRQTIDYPGVYTAQKNALEQKVRMAENEKQMTVQELALNIRQAFNEYLYLVEKENLISQQDSLYRNLLVINDVRYTVGQISQLEKINGESQYQKILFNLKETRSALQTIKYRFSILLGMPRDSVFVPSAIYKASDVNFEITEDSSAYATNPTIQYLKSTETYFEQSLKVEKRRKIPGLTFGYLNQGTDNTTPMNYRLVYGISLPLGRLFQSGHVQAAEKEVELARMETSVQYLKLDYQYQKALYDYERYKAMLDNFNEITLRQANEILRDANESFRLGSTSYYNYLQNIELSYQIRSSYLETVKDFNNAILSIQYITGNITQ